MSLLLFFSGQASAVTNNQSLTATAVTCAATLLNQVGKNVTATAITCTATLTALRTFLKTMTATAVTGTATFLKSVGKVLAPTVSVTTTVINQISKTLSGLSTSTALLGKGRFVSLLATVTTIATNGATYTQSVVLSLSIVTRQTYTDIVSKLTRSDITKRGGRA